MLKTLASANDLKLSIEEATRKINGDIDEIWRNVADFKGMASRMSMQKDINEATVKKLVSENTQSLLITACYSKVKCSH